MRFPVPGTSENRAASQSNLRYGDAVPTARRHLNTDQFPQRINIATATPDNGWIGPLGMYSPWSPSGSLYGYGVAPDNPRY